MNETHAALRPQAKVVLSTLAAGYAFFGLTILMAGRRADPNVLVVLLALAVTAAAFCLVFSWSGTNVVRAHPEFGCRAIVWAGLLLGGLLVLLSVLFMVALLTAPKDGLGLGPFIYTVF